MIPERMSPQAYALMRMVFGLIFVMFGLQKFGMLGGQAVPLASIYGAAGIIEVVGGLLIAIGLFTKVAAFIASGEMAFAYFIEHQPQGALPVQNMGAEAVLFCFAFLFMAARGSGIWSMDSLMSRPQQHVVERRDRAA
jgi:putative oxidoreductase